MKIQIVHNLDGYWLHVYGPSGNSACIHLESHSPLVNAVLQEVAVELGHEEEVVAKGGENA